MNATHALGWALVHFLWQGAALAILLVLALALTRPSASRTRYVLSLLTLTAMLVVPIATGLRLLSSLESGAPLPAATSTESAGTDRSPVPASDRVAASAPAPAPAPAPAAVNLPALRDLVSPALPWFVGAWVLGVVALSIRLAHGLANARRLRSSGTRAVSISLQQLVARLAARMRVSRPVQLLESLLVDVPAVIGWLRPVILVPASALTGLTPQQLEVLLAHELAHVRRYDYLVNVFQCVIETLLFYHPAVWWVSRRVREEREHCCDDLVVQLCGDRRVYALALVEMERLRPAVPPLALAATGGSLVQRVTRLIRPTNERAEFFPRWMAGIAGVLAVTVALLASGSDRLAGETTRPPVIVADTGRMAPDTVLRHPDPSQPFAQRWEWARTQARQLGRRTYWIGYQLSRPEWLEHSVYIDRGAQITGQNIHLSGQLFGDFEGLVFRGVRLGPLVQSTDSDDIAILFGFGTDQTGQTTLSQVHVSSFYLPIDFRGRTLLWLGSAIDAQSLPIVEGLFGATTLKALREDIVAAAGIHGSSAAVVPLLLRWLNSREHNDVRSQAAEWLGFHPTAAAVTALSRAARTDASGDVRRQAAEALGENTHPAALDSTIAIALSAGDSETRRQAVEGLSRKDDAKALSALSDIARSDRDEDVQREAVETLGALSGGHGHAALRELARTHPRPDVRREAVETLGENLPPKDAIATLKAIATDDPDSDVQRAAVETLGGVEGGAAEALAILTSFARTHPSPDIRRKAIETLGELGDSRALAIVAGIARAGGDVDVRRKAIETYAEHARTDSALALFKGILAGDAPEDVYRKVLESLEELDGGAGIPTLIDAARSHPNREVRMAALRRLAESDDPRAQQVFDQTLRRP